MFCAKIRSCDKISTVKKSQTVGVLRVLIVSFAACVLCGCTLAAKERVLVKGAKSSARTDKIIDKDALQKGGKLLIVPFKPGAGVAADEETNRIALMFVKGMTEAVETGSSSLKIVASGEAADADFIIKGYITKTAEIKGMKRWLPGSGKIQLGIEGKIVDVRTDLIVYHFSRNQIAQKKEKDFKAMAYDLGKEVGQFVSHVE